MTGGDDEGAPGVDRTGDLEDAAVQIRGIYTTAITRLLRTGGARIVLPSRPIRERFDADFADDPPAVTIRSTDDRQGIAITGDPDATDAVRTAVQGVGRDAMVWADPAPAGAVFEGVVDRTRGGGAVLDLPAGAEGYLPFDAVDGYVDVGDRFRVQVREPEPPWTDDAPLLGTGTEVGNALVTLRRGAEGVTAAASGGDATELVRSTELLSVSSPDGWGVRWERPALDVALETLEEALATASEEAIDLDEQIDQHAPDSNSEGGHPEAIATPSATSWCWFGRESRFALDEWRRKVTTTMRGHHRIKAGSEAAGAAVDLVESVCVDPTGEFPIDAVVRQFGPAVGDRIPIEHGKPDGRLYALGRGEVTEFDPDDGQITVRREMQSEGTYDALGTDRVPGDIAITKLKEGRWWYPTVYRGTDGASKGTYVNVCTPVELFPDGARYVDLHVDVIKRPDGEVAVVDEAELDEAVDAGEVDEDLAEKARGVAAAVERALS